MTTNTAGASFPASFGHRLLVEVEEISLEDVLLRIRASALAKEQATAPVPPTGLITPASVRQLPTAVPEALPPPLGPAPAHAHPRLPYYPVPALQRLVAAHFRATRAPDLSVAGTRPLALVYLLVAALVAAPRCQAVVVVDLEGRFDASVLVGKRPVVLEDLSTDRTREANAFVTAADLAHIHVLRVDPRWRAPLADAVAVAEQRVLYGAQRARDRPWWGTLVIGGGVGGGGGGGLGGGTGEERDYSTPRSSVPPRSTPGPALVTGYYGWLRVDVLDPDPQKTRDTRREWLLRAVEDGREVAGKLNSGDKDGLGWPAAVYPLTWVASSPWGNFSFQLRDESGQDESGQDERAWMNV